MLDIKLIRQNPELVRANISRRKDNEKLLLFDKLIIEDKKWRNMLSKLELLKHKKNILSRELLNEKDFKKHNAAKKLREEIKQLQEEERRQHKIVTDLLLKMPNLLHDSVPFGVDDNDNVVIKEYKKPQKYDFQLRHHGDLALFLDQADFKRAAKIAGTGFFFLKNNLVLLDLALQRFAIDILIKKGFSLIEPPFLMRRDPYIGVTDLDFFENQLYHIRDEDLFLVATSEHPIAAMYMNETLKEDDLPIKYAGISPCFRKEVGKHNIDEKGFFRVHHFNKIEQFIFCKEEESWQLFEELADNAAELLKLLEIPYQITNVCIGDIGNVATKKYDINGWSPRENKYIELMSCSHCSDYQARRLKIKYIKGSEKKYVNTLNSTMVATTRTLRCIIENYQTKEGTIKIPKVLIPYMNGIREIRPT